MSNFLDLLVHALILAMIGIMLGEWIMAKTNEYRAKRKGTILFNRYHGSSNSSNVGGEGYH